MKMQEKIGLLLAVVMAVVSVESVAAIIPKEDISVVSNTSGMYDWSLSRYVVYKTKDGRYFAGQDNLFCKGDCKDGGSNGIDTDTTALFDSPQEALKKQYGSKSKCDYQKKTNPKSNPKTLKKSPPVPSRPNCHRFLNLQIFPKFRVICFLRI